MKPIPAADVLLEACARYLEHELLPTLDGYHRFQTRVTVNALHTVVRELRLRPAMVAAEAQRLGELLPGASGTAAAIDPDPDPDTRLASAERELCRRIDEGVLPIDDPALIEHLRASLRDALAIDSPKWLPPST
ncbi:MAG: hypothetical protein JWQ11_2446 [Rhizobacter sp.]|nr:hypothetical protein [Rhizobacter sp.]